MLLNSVQFNGQEVVCPSNKLIAINMSL